ncbi:hypothetical protein SprV_0200857200 [Sparganum proliferum]
MLGPLQAMAAMLVGHILSGAEQRRVCHFRSVSQHNCSRPHFDDTFFVVKTTDIEHVKEMLTSVDPDIQSTKESEINDKLPILNMLARRLLMQSKDKLPSAEISGIVYKINCNEGDYSYVEKQNGIGGPVYESTNRGKIQILN